MTSYEKAINYIIIENDIRTTEGIREFGEDDDCESAKKYFKTVQDGANDCIFRTADRVWWDITDITNPIISLKDEITDSNKVTIRANALSLEADKTSFALIGRFDDLGTLRINDNAYEQSKLRNNDYKKFMAKLWSFVTNTNVEMVADSFALCKANNVQTCTIINSNGEEVEYSIIPITAHTAIMNDGRTNFTGYDRETKKDINFTSATTPGDYYIKNYGVIITEEEAKSEENFASSISEYCRTSGDYWEAAKRKCESEGARLPSLAELQYLGRQRQIGGSAWAAEERTTSTFMTNFAGGIDVYGKNKTNYRVICIGVE